MLFDEPGRIGSGGNSGFQAINLAAQFGARRILLIGFDMHATSGLHWYGPNTGRNRRNPSDVNFVHWRRALNQQSRVLNRMGIDVVNCSSDSTVTGFRLGGVEQTLREWGA